jgi:peptidoglycan/LPS O-acetylase OafA/YrhL
MKALSWLFTRLRPMPGLARPERDQPLEALRGICAVLVLLSHLLIPLPTVDPGFKPPDRLFAWLNLGLPAVLIFFVLSGYVIGLTTRGPASPAGVADYLRRRAWRLLPVTFAAILLSWCLHPAVSGPMLLGNFLFLQNHLPYPVTGWFLPPLVNNQALWTLHYEVLYYGLFLVVWRFAAPVGAVLALGALGAFGMALGWPVSEFFGRAACGALYWFAGLAVAWLTNPPAGKDRRTAWPAALLGAYALWQLGGLRAVLLHAEADKLMWPTALSPHRLDFLPAALWCLLAVTGRAPRAETILAGACVAWGWLGAGSYLWLGYWPDQNWPALLALVVASASLGRRFSPDGLARLAPLGAISFGVYAFASPLQIALAARWPELSGSLATFVLRCVVLVLLTAGLAWLVDHRLHAWLAARRRR